MSLKETLRRERDVIVYGQSLRFRLVKYAVLLCGALALYLFTGLTTVLLTMVTLALFGVALHLYVRYKTNGWKKSWGLYTKNEENYD